MGLTSLPPIWTMSANILLFFYDGKTTGIYESFDHWKFFKTNIYELVEDGNFIRSSCGEGLKKYVCKHSIAMSIKFKGLEILDLAK